MTWHGTNCDVQTNENEIEFKAIQPSQEGVSSFCQWKEDDLMLPSKVGTFTMTWLHYQYGFKSSKMKYWWNMSLGEINSQEDIKRPTLNQLTFWECELCDKMLAPKNVMMRSWMKLLFLKTMSIEIFWNICM